MSERKRTHIQITITHDRSISQAEAKAIADKLKRRARGLVDGSPRARRSDRPGHAAAKRVDGGSLLRAIGAQTPTDAIGMVVGTPGDAYDILERGYRYGITKGAEGLGVIQPDEGAAMRQRPAEVPFGAQAMTR